MPSVPGPARRFEMPDFMSRSLVEGDETEAWAGWLEDPGLARQLNARPGRRPLAEIRRYIAGFDRIDRHLFGIFRPSPETLIGLWTIEIDRPRRAFTAHMLVGDKAERSQGAKEQSSIALMNWAFEVCDLLWCESSIVATNRKMLRHVRETGWTVVGTGLAPSAAGGPMVDIVRVRRHRDVWRKDPRSSFVTGDPVLTGLEPVAPG
ncbi:MAG: hypothetical protein QM698_05340 [Micropepsaceae bacterium]